MWNQIQEWIEKQYNTVQIPGLLYTRTHRGIVFIILLSSESRNTAFAVIL